MDPHGKLKCAPIISNSRVKKPAALRKSQYCPNGRASKVSPSPHRVMTEILPNPAENPTADVVIFDGKCQFCRGQIARLRRLDRGKRLTYLSLHDPETVRRYPDLSHDQLMEEMFVVDQAGRRYGGARALRYLSRRLPRMWWAAPALHVPFSYPLWSWLYKQVAQRRYKLAGKTDCETDACKVHLRS